MSANAPAFDTIVPRTLTICTYVEFAPFAYEAHGEVVGTDIALLRRFAAQQGLDVRIIKKPFAGLWYTPGAGECDIAAAGIAAREDRDLGTHGVWSMPYMTVQRSLLIHASEAEVLKTPEDFAGKKIVVTPGSTAELDAQERYAPRGAEVIPVVPSQETIVRRLLNHEIDAFGEGDVSNRYLAETYGDTPGQLLVLTDIHTMATPEDLHFAVRAADSRLVERLNAFIKSLLN